MAQQVQQLTVIAPDQNMVHYQVTRDTTVAIVRSVVACLRGFGEAEVEAMLSVGPDYIPVPDHLHLWEPATCQCTLVFQQPGRPRFVDNGDDADGDQKRAKVVFVHGGEAFKSVLLR